MEKKYYTSGEISKKYNSLTKDKKIEILYEAMDYMQAYNGRSKFLCIAMVMGFANHEGDEKSYYKRDKK